MQRSLQDIMADDSIENKSAAARATLRAFDRFQDAEYNTAVARSRTAKQFETFMDPDNVRLFPNLRWLASRSANPRAVHQAFYDRVWRKDDPFWSSHAPGTEWNCKCDVEETDDPVTENTDFEMPKAPRGLEGNPAQTGEVFTDNASYISKGSKVQNIQKAVEECTYPDYESNLQISVVADRVELRENIRTGRILAKENDVIVAPHVLEKGKPNPEFIINGEVADAKRIEREGGVTSGFKKALKQKCTVVVIDLNANFKAKNKIPNFNNLAKYINWRRNDLDNGISCIVVYGEKQVTITSRNTTKDSIIAALETIKP